MSNLQDFETTELLAELKRRYNCLGKPEGNFLVMGPPGSGKGTQSMNIRDSHCYCHISTGDIIREAIKQKTSIGLEAKKLTDNGFLVPDGMLGDLLEDRLASPRCRRGFLLDGYPRNVTQSQHLSSILDKLGKKLNGVLFFEVSEDEAVKRISGRMVHPGSNRVYHKTYKPPKVDGLDDITGEPLVTRPDDCAEVVKKRLNVYKELTTPVIDYYRGLGLLKSIDASKPEQEVLKSIEKVISQYKSS